MGFYLNIIYETSFDVDNLPEIYLGTFVTFFWHVIKPFFLFFITMAVVQLPFILILIFSGLEITSDNFWHGHTFTHLLLQIFFLLGLFLFPVAIITTAVGRDITMFRPDYFLKPIIKAFIPYVFITALLVIAVVFLTKADQYAANDSSKIQFSLTLNLLVQVLAIAAMRAIGLFYRHYSCYFSW